MIEAVLFDALGTLLRLDPPAPRLQASLAARLSLELPLDRCQAAMRAELRHYGANCIRARDADSLALVRLECAEVLADVLAAGPSGPELLVCLSDAISFSAFPDAAPALAELARNRRIGIVSNWDVSLPPVLQRLGLAEHVETVVHAAEVGGAKPDPLPFVVALERLSLPPGACVHVGDDAVTDGAGARAAGIEPILIDRTHGASGAGRIRSLLELPGLLARQEQAA